MTSAAVRRRLPVVGWAVFTLSVAEIVGALLVGVEIDVVGLTAVFFVLSFGLVGAVVVRGRPHHPVGWIMLLAGFCFASGGLLISYVEHSATFPTPLTVWLANWSFGLGTGVSATFLMLLFPTGHLPSPRWRPVAWLAGVTLALLLVGVVISPEPFEQLPIENPLALEVDPLLLEIGFYLFLATIGASVASVVLRFRYATHEERQQLKWVVWAVVVIAIVFLSTLLWEVTNGSADVSEDVENFIIASGLSLLPVAIGIAILRYRLFEIDRIISRTVAYALIGIVLASVYALGVIGLQNLIPASGDLPVAASTLAAAALFNPLRRKVQTIVDRRFNRPKYDAVLVIEELVGHLRDRVELEAVTAQVLAATGRTLQPVNVSFWVRKTTS